VRGAATSTRTTYAARLLSVSGFTVFSSLSATVHSNYATSPTNPWAGSPFEWIHDAQSGRKGAVGKRLVRAWAEGEGLHVAGKSGRGHDFRASGNRVAVKLSLLWSDGRFVFQQIKDQSYDVVALLALEPQRARLWLVPKSVLWQRAEWQHTGREGQDTKWLHFHATMPPAWLSSGYGAGGLQRAKHALK
jgi:hypothetical protein